MTPLRAKYIRDLTVRGRAQRTQRAYTRYVSELAHYYQRSPELISYEEVTNWLYHLIRDRLLSAFYRSCPPRLLNPLISVEFASSRIRVRSQIR
jgi:hypothetical protein